MGIEGPSGKPGRVHVPREAMETTVLIVDDDPYIVDILAGFVPASMRCLTASTRAMALEVIASSTHLHGLAADVRLGDGSGLDLIDPWIDKFPEAPLVLITGYYEKEPRVPNQAYLKSCHFLVKPFARPEFDMFTSNVQAARWGVPRSVAAKFAAFVSHHRLTPKQADLLAMHVRKMPRRAIADLLGISMTTLRTRERQLCDKVGLRTIEDVCALLKPD